MTISPAFRRRRPSSVRRRQSPCLEVLSFHTSFSAACDGTTVSNSIGKKWTIQRFQMLPPAPCGCGKLSLYGSSGRLCRARRHYAASTTRSPADRTGQGLCAAPGCDLMTRPMLRSAAKSNGISNVAQNAGGKLRSGSRFSCVWKGTDNSTRVIVN